MNSEKTVRIYISPANHYKRYAIEGHTEKEQMDLLAPLLVKELERYEGADVHLCTVYDSDRSFTGRPEEAKDLGCDVYIALHTNAGGGTGACVFYHPDYPLSEALAMETVKALNAICPIKSNRAKQPAIYAWSKKLWNFGELRIPASYGMAPILIEHEFHDNAEGARWIVNSLPQIAEADAEAIARVLGLGKKRIVGDVNGDGTANSQDAALILRHDADIAPLDEDGLSAADVNGDGKVNSQDAAELLRRDAGLSK